ncbi:hypothetical protein ABPG72_015882 [Tetrahymena utriculariae]
MSLQDQLEKYKKVSCIKDKSQEDIQNLYFSKDHQTSSIKSDRIIKKSSLINTQISPQSNSLRSIFMNRERLQNKTDLRESKISHTNNFDTFLTSSNAYQNDSSQDTEKFIKNNKLLFFTSRKQKTNNSFHDPRVVSFCLNRSTKNISDKEKYNQFTTNSSISPKIKQNLDQSLISKNNRISLNLEQAYGKSMTEIKLQRKSTPITGFQEKSRFIQNISFHKKIPQQKICDYSNINQAQQESDQLNNFQKANLDDGKYKQQFQDTIIEDKYSPTLQKQTTLQMMINRIHTKQPNLQSCDNTEQENYLQEKQQPFVSSPLSASKSPLSKKLDIINLRFAQMENQKIKKESQHSKQNKYFIKLNQNFQTDSPLSEKEKLNRTLRSDKRVNAQKSFSSFHNQSMEQNQFFDNNSPTKKIPFIKNLNLISEQNKNPLDLDTPQDNSIQLNQQVKKMFQQKGYHTHAHGQLQSTQKSPIKNFNYLYSQTPAATLENDKKDNKINFIQPIDNSKKSVGNVRSSNIFSNYVALTFRNNLLELRRRAQSQIIQKLSFESRQALKRLVIYINDMNQEYENIKKVSQSIYQLVYHIPYLVKMLFKSKKIVLRDKIDLPFITKFLTNRTNMGYIESKSESFDQMLDNKIKVDITFLNERLMEFIQKKFQDRFSLITKNIIEEHEKVQSLEEKIEEKIAKTRGLIPKTDKQLLRNKHNYQCVENYLFHQKLKNQNTFAQTFQSEQNRLGSFQIIDRQNVIINNELDNIYTQVQNQTTNKAQIHLFQNQDDKQLYQQEIQNI